MKPRVSQSIDHSKDTTELDLDEAFTVPSLNDFDDKVFADFIFDEDAQPSGANCENHSDHTNVNFQKHEYAAEAAFMHHTPNDARKSVKCAVQPLELSAFTENEEPTEEAKDAVEHRQSESRKSSCQSTRSKATSVTSRREMSQRQKAPMNCNSPDMIGGVALPKFELMKDQRTGYLTKISVKGLNEYKKSTTQGTDNDNDNSRQSSKISRSAKSEANSLRANQRPSIIKNPNKTDVMDIAIQNFPRSVLPLR